MGGVMQDRPGRPTSCWRRWRPTWRRRPSSRRYRPSIASACGLPPTSARSSARETEPLAPDRRGLDALAREIRSGRLGRAPAGACRDPAHQGPRQARRRPPRLGAAAGVGDRFHGGVGSQGAQTRGRSAGTEALDSRPWAPVPSCVPGVSLAARAGCPLATRRPGREGFRGRAGTGTAGSRGRDGTGDAGGRHGDVTLQTGDPGVQAAPWRPYSRIGGVSLHGRALTDGTDVTSDQETWSPTRLPHPSVEILPSPDTSPASPRTSPRRARPLGGRRAACQGRRREGGAPYPRAPAVHGPRTPSCSFCRIDRHKEQRQARCRAAPWNRPAPRSIPPPGTSWRIASKGRGSSGWALRKVSSS